MSIRKAATLLVLTVAASLVHVAAAPALGVIGSFGSSGPGTLIEGRGIAVDPNSGDVYVADRGANRVVKYDQSGNFILTFGWEVNETKDATAASQAEKNVCTEAEIVVSGVKCKAGVAGSEPGQLADPAGVAVDPTGGDVYVNASGDKSFYDNRVERFGSDGQYRSEIIAGENGAPEFDLHPYDNGLAVDTEGDLYVVSWVGAAVFKFNPDGTYSGERFVPPTTGGPPTGGSWEWTFPTDVAVDPNGTLYVTQGFGHPVVKFSAGGEALEALPCKQSTDEAGVTANLFNGEVFIVGESAQQYICQYDASGKLVTEFQPAYSGSRMEELAYGTSAGRLYEVYGGYVAMYGTFPLPTQAAPSVSHEDWSNASLTSITLTARVNPHSLDTTYCFQYATNPDFSGAACEPASPGDAGAGFLPVTESVNVTGLSQSTTYYYRLVAHNAYGGGAGTTVDGPTQTFTTLAPLPSVTTEEAGEESYDAATVHGTVIPGSTGAASETMWCFQYGTTDVSGYDLGFLPGVPAGDAGQGTNPVSVSVRLTRLEPGTTYRYRLVAVNSLGLRLASTACGTQGGHESDGAEGTFTTAASGPGPLAVSGPLAALAQNAASLTGTVDPQGTRTVYDFQLGADVKYGVDLFGEAGAGTEPEPVSVVVSALQPGTTYHYRLVASSRYGASYGADMSFTTPAFPSSVLSAPIAPPLLASSPVAFPGEARVSTRTSKCRRGHKRNRHGRCVKVKRKKQQRRGKARKAARHGARVHGKGARAGSR